MADGFGIRSVEVRGFRSARAVQLAPGAVCALVGGPSVGKSNLLDAIWTLLQNGEPAPSAGDVSVYPTQTTAPFTIAGPTAADQCKNGGWAVFGIFKNQGDCVSYVATGGKNPPNG